VKVSSHHTKEEECNSSEWPDRIEGKQLFRSLPCPTAGWVTVSHSVTLVYLTIVTVIIHHTLRIYYVALFFVEIFFL